MRSSSIASRSAAATGDAKGSIPASSASSRSSRAHRPGEGRDRELLVGDGQPVLDALAQAVRGAVAEGQREHGVRSPGVLGQPRETLHEHRRLPAARSAQDEQRAAGVLDGLALGGGQHGRHRRRIGPHGCRLTRLAGGVPAVGGGDPDDAGRASDDRRARQGDRARAGRAVTARCRSTPPPKTVVFAELQQLLRRTVTASPRSARSAGSWTSAIPTGWS